MSLNDSPELREKLSLAWRALIERLLASDHPSAAVAETMFEVALEQLSNVHGAATAANYVHLLADQMLAAEKERVNALLAG